jgi:branched-chain amino acid transport system ATP-binding protein
MEAVFALADRLTVLVYGRIIASGSPQAVRADAAVRQAYLGEKESRGQVAHQHAHQDTHQGGRHG